MIAISTYRRDHQKAYNGEVSKVETTDRTNRLVDLFTCEGLEITKMKSVL